eukprot:TRINITY_DN8436_c0_g1_i1.p4 TRINITY_DN8436_c0_g1~~TRINITY_DN8436_c0_g1_i1.p4  ORF type:complete len:148 (-),score=9.81 TRINITY_DN8436_c0_g1_i1:181-624(-)
MAHSLLSPPLSVARLVPFAHRQRALAQRTCRCSAKEEKRRRRGGHARLAAPTSSAGPAQRPRECTTTNAADAAPTAAGPALGGGRPQAAADVARTPSPRNRPAGGRCAWPLAHRRPPIDTPTAAGAVWALSLGCPRRGLPRRPPLRC